MTTIFARRALPVALRTRTPCVLGHALTRTAVRARRVDLPASPLLPIARVQQRTWFSSEDPLPGSKIWSFDEVKKQAVEPDSKVIIVDVREPGELQSTGKIPGAINIPITSAVQSFHVSEEDFEDMYGFERPSRDRTLLFYCKAGVRAKSAAGLAKHAGWDDVGEYPGSWIDWEANGGPVEKVNGQK